jgi:hypothetical protein
MVTTPAAAPVFRTVLRVQPEPFGSLGVFRFFSFVPGINHILSIGRCSCIAALRRVLFLRRMRSKFVRTSLPWNLAHSFAKSRSAYCKRHQRKRRLWRYRPSQIVLGQASQLCYLPRPGIITEDSRESASTKRHHCWVTRPWESIGFT